MEKEDRERRAEQRGEGGEGRVECEGREGRIKRGEWRGKGRERKSEKGEWKGDGREGTAMGSAEGSLLRGN